MMEKVQIYVNTNEQGIIIEAIAGEMIIPEKQYDFFFYEDYEVAENIEKYMVVIENLKPHLKLIENVV